MPADVVELPRAVEPNELIASDPVTERLVSLARSVAATPSTVMLAGESGVGKEVIARFIHRTSPRASRAFVGVNCAALPPTLLESELFGHEKGAFSGAVSRHAGLFERAEGGTILLDEISEMALDLQAKLLRVLQERTFYRVGGEKPIDLDVRVIATTNRDLKECVEAGTFRLDLFYRLNVFPLHLPALRERRGDIRPLALRYLAKFNRSLARNIRGVHESALEKLEGYDFPGNVRELTNLVERATILAGDEEFVKPEHITLDAAVSPVDQGFDRAPTQHSAMRFVPGAQPLTDIRMRVILKTLERYDGNRTRTADALGISVRTIRTKLKHYRERGQSIPESGQGS